MDHNALSRWCNYVLTRLYGHVTNAELDSRRKEMQIAWQTPSSYVDYDDEITQAAYIRSDVPFRAHFITKLFRTHTCLPSIFLNAKMTGDQVRIVVVGCGPSTEMLGVLNFLIENWTNEIGQYPVPVIIPSIPEVRFLLLDRVTSWSRPIDLFENAIRVETAQWNCPLSFEKSFYPYSITHVPDDENPLCVTHLPSCKSANIFMFSMLFSEILKEPPVAVQIAMKNIRDMFECAKAGAFFLFIDVDERNLTQLMMNHLETNIFNEGNSLKMVDSFSAVLPWVQAHQKELGYYFENTNTPVITGKMFVLLYTKKPMDIYTF